MEYFRHRKSWCATDSLADFAKLVELFDTHGVSFVSVTQQFNTTTSMGRLTLNVLLSFAQFEREVTSERIRDKIAASKRKGLWIGGMAPLGYDTRTARSPSTGLRPRRCGPSSAAISSSAV
jgi:DNA invertase Pin-like site-specific DNA recombinase